MFLDFLTDFPMLIAFPQRLFMFGMCFVLVQLLIVIVVVYDAASLFPIFAGGMLVTVGLLAYRFLAIVKFLNAAVKAG